MEEYTFEEVISKIKEGETYQCNESGYVVKTIYKSEGGFRFNNNEPMDFCGINNMQRFVKVEKPVSFMEAVASEKNMIKVGVEDIIDGMSDNLKEQLREYNTIGATLYCLSNYFTNESLVKIFQEGKWYIEN